MFIVEESKVMEAREVSSILSKKMSDEALVDFFFHQLPFPDFDIPARVKQLALNGAKNKWLPISEAPKNEVVLGITESGEIQFVSYYPGSKKWLTNAFEKHQAVVGYRTLESLGKFEQ